jgi:hypothetical protein
MRNLILILAICLDIATFASETTGGNGNETYFAHANPWFVGDEPIQYCVDTDSDLLIYREEFAASIRKSIATWTGFLKLYGIDKMKFGQGPYYFPDGIPRQSYKAQIVSRVQKPQGDPSRMPKDGNFSSGADKETLLQWAMSKD